jgi:hypothetical protein
LIFTRKVKTTILWAGQRNEKAGFNQYGADQDEDHKTFYYPIRKQARKAKPANTKLPLHPSAVVKRLQYIIKDIIPVFESH